MMKSDSVIIARRELHSDDQLAITTKFVGTICHFRIRGRMDLSGARRSIAWTRNTFLNTNDDVSANRTNKHVYGQCLWAPEFVNGQAYKGAGARHN